MLSIESRGLRREELLLLLLDGGNGNCSRKNREREVEGSTLGIKGVDSVTANEFARDGDAERDGERERGDLVWS